MMLAEAPPDASAARELFDRVGRLLADLGG
jgi:hypothetical protein